MRSFGISEGNITGRGRKKKKKKTPQNMSLTATPSGEVAQMLTSASSEQGLNRVLPVALLRVRTWTECPEDKLRELTGDINPNCGVARESEKNKKRENFPGKSLNLRHSLARSQNKGQSEY